MHASATTDCGGFQSIRCTAVMGSAFTGFVTASSTRLALRRLVHVSSLGVLSVDSKLLAEERRVRVDASAAGDGTACMRASTAGCDYFTLSSKHDAYERAPASFAARAPTAMATVKPLVMAAPEGPWRWREEVVRHVLVDEEGLCARVTRGQPRSCRKCSGQSAAGPWCPCRWPG